MLLRNGLNRQCAVFRRCIQRPINGARNHFDNRVSTRWLTDGKRPRDDAAIVSLMAPKSFAVGCLAGLAGSLAGMGGGFVMIPLMTSMLRLTQHQAHGTSLFAVASTGIAGALGYASQENVVQWDSAAAIAFTGMISARFGANATTFLSGHNLKRALGAFMLFVSPIVPAKAYMQGLEKKKIHIEKNSGLVASNTWWERQQRLVAPCLIGLGSGYLAGLFGVGGGAIVVPALSVATDMTHYQALGTSLCAMAFPAIVGTLTHHSNGNVYFRGGMAPALAMGAFCGAYVGGRIGLKTDETALRFGFSGVMAVLGFKTLMR